MLWQVQESRVLRDVCENGMGRGREIKMSTSEYSAAVNLIGLIEMYRLKKNFTFESGVDNEGLCIAIREKVLQKLIARERKELANEP